jgi:hypothetical protein
VGRATSAEWVDGGPDRIWILGNPDACNFELDRRTRAFARQFLFVDLARYDR